MKRNVSAVLGAAVMVLWASAASAQGKFDGKWAVDTEKTQAANPAPQGDGGGRRGGMGGGMGAMTIVVGGGELAITRAGRDGAENTMTYKLDGSEQVMTMGQGSAKVKATQEGDKITIVTTRETERGAMTTTAVYMIEGDYLVVANTSPARGGGEPMTRKTFYKKAS
jgi:hypothetical protein